MNWDAIGAVGELLSAVAVLVTLVYLSIQVRSTKDELRRSFLQNRDNAVRTLMQESSSNPFLMGALAKVRNITGASPPGLQELKEAFQLSDDEAQALASNNVAWWLYRSETLTNIDLLAPEQKADFDRHIVLNYKSGSGKVWWEAWKKTLPKGQPIVAYVDKILVESR